MEINPDITKDLKDLNVKIKKYKTKNYGNLNEIDKLTDKIQQLEKMTFKIIKSIERNLVIKS